MNSSINCSYRAADFDQALAQLRAGRERSDRLVEQSLPRLRQLLVGRIGLAGRLGLAVGVERLDDAARQLGDRHPGELLELLVGPPSAGDRGQRAGSARRGDLGVAVP